MTRYRFEWDPDKARANFEKHHVTFEEAVTVLRDPSALNLYDQSHSLEEDRWISLGLSGSGRLLTVIHTFLEESTGIAGIRIISARRATRQESRQYQDRHT